MGNCQAAEVAAAVVQHPAGGPGGGSGRVERLYWSTSAAEVMRANPGHYVALVTLRVAEDRGSGSGNNNTTVRRLTRVRLLKPKEPLLLGHVYRLITAHEVTKAVQARKEEKQRKAQQQQQQQMEYLTSRLQRKAPAAATEADDEHDGDVDEEEAALDESLDQLARQDSAHRSSGARQHRQWRPSLHSIDEAAS